MNPVYRNRYTIKLRDGTYAVCDMNSPYKYLDLIIQKLGELEDEEEKRLEK